VVALTLIPMLASRQLRTDEVAATKTGESTLSRRAGELVLVLLSAPLRLLLGLLGLLARLGGALLKPFLDLFDGALCAIGTAYSRLLGAVLRRPAITLAVTLVLLAASLGLYPQLGSELIPELIQGEFFANLELPPGTRLEVTDRRLVELGQAAAALDGARTVYTIAGTSNQQGGAAGELREHVGQLTVTLGPPVSRQREDAAMAEIREAVAGANRELAGGAGGEPVLKAVFGRPSFFSFKTAIEVEISGFNVELLERLASQVAGRMRAIPGLADVKASTEGGHPELQVQLDRDRLATYGLSVAEVADVLRTKVQGTVATDITRSDRTIDIRLRAAEEARDSARDLGDLTVARIEAVAIPLAAVGQVVEVEGPAEILRADGTRMARISANLDGRTLSWVSEDLKSELAAMAATWPAGYDWRLSGQEQEMETSFGSMRLAIGLAVFMVYLVMASQFESLLHPLVILFSVPCAVIGVLATMWLFGVTLSVVALIGFILLAGIVVNNAIVLVDYTNRLRRRGLGKLEALEKAGRVRLRPILMTTATTVLGLLPMALGLGEGAELRTPMALTVIGGMITSTLLTLLVVPAVYALLDRRP
jgi:HAE1 family hydrophobic/amphiphilic exporter-1